MKRTALKFFLLTTMISSGALASREALDFSIHQEYFSARAMGMGNAFTAVADDYSAIFYNPAALANRTDGNMHFYLGAGATSNTTDLMDDIDKAGKADKADQASAYADVLNKYMGDHFNFRVPLGAAWVRPNWGIAFLPVNLDLDLSIHRLGIAALNVVAYNDSILAYSYARKVKWLEKGNDLSVGATLKAVNRVYFNQQLSAADLVQSSDVVDKDAATEGLTVDMDLGFLLKPKHAETGFLAATDPTFSLVVRNIADYGFPTNMNLVTEKDNGKEPPKLQRRIDVGSKWQVPKFWIFDPYLTFDVRDMLHENWNWKKGTHAGAELYWTIFNWWKGSWSVGLNQGYFTAGFGARFAFFQLNLATWGEEVGTESSPMESRRYMLEAALDF